MYRRGFFALMCCGWLAGLFSASGCLTPESEQPIVLAPPPKEQLILPEKGLITIQHVLVGFEDKVGGKFIDRTEEQARELAMELKKRADAGENFDALVEEYTADAVPGIYKLADNGIDRHMLPKDIHPRSDMVAAFGDVAFSLEVGEVGVTEYDEVKSPYGFHVVKRLE